MWPHLFCKEILISWKITALIVPVDRCAFRNIMSANWRLVSLFKKNLWLFFYRFIESRYKCRGCFIVVLGRTVYAFKYIHLSTNNLGLCLIFYHFSNFSINLQLYSSLEWPSSFRLPLFSALCSSPWAVLLQFIHTRYLVFWLRAFTRGSTIPRRVIIPIHLRRLPS